MRCSSLNVNIVADSLDMDADCDAKVIIRCERCK